MMFQPMPALLAQISPELAMASAAALLLLLAVTLLLLQSAKLSRLADQQGHEQRALRDLMMELDRGLRREIATGTREGLEAAFDRVQAGLKAQGESLESFGRFQREAIDQSLRVFGEQQRDRLAQSDKTLKDGIDALQTTLTAFKAHVQDSVDRAAIASDTALLNFGLRLSALDTTLRDEQEKLRTQVAERLDAMRVGNEAKLEEMRRAVDEKLQSALEKQLKDSFNNLQEQLSAVQQAIGQVQSVAGEVGDLKRLFSNVKSRGGWGEAQLETMLTDLLPQGAFEKNFRVRETSAELVEFALRVPGRDGGHAWLPVDSKFPTEDYTRLIAANEAGLREEEAAARTALARNLRLEAQKIRDKYISVPRTLDYGILYVPSDSLFAEVARIPGLVESIRDKHHVMLMGPSLLPAFLHTLSISYATLALEQKASVIGEMLAAVKTEWGKFGEALSAIDKQAKTLSSGIERTLVRQRAIDRKLRTVDSVEHVQADVILGLSDPLLLQADEDDAA